MSKEVTIYDADELSFDEAFEHVVAEVSSGRSVSSILREDPGMPAARKFWSRLYRDDDLFEKISRAREMGVEAVLEDARHIADNPLQGEELTLEQGPDGVKRRVTRKEMLGHRRLQIDTRVKYAQMIAPRKYGAKLDLTSDGEKINDLSAAIAAGNARLEEKKDG